MRAIQMMPAHIFKHEREPNWMAHTVAARPSGSVVAARATGHDTELNSFRQFDGDTAAGLDSLAEQLVTRCLFRTLS